MIKISKILRGAVDRLASTSLYNGCTFSCNAIRYELLLGYPDLSREERDQWMLQIDRGLEEMGLWSNGTDANQFGEFERSKGRYWTPKSQQARALWLTWAALMAEEQGV